MAIIGLNEGPFLIMTLAYENGHFTIADPVESKVPTIKLSPADSIALAENFSKLCPPQSKPTLTDSIQSAVNESLDEEKPEEIIDLEDMTFKVRAWGCDYTVTVKAFIDDDEWSSVRTYMEIHNGNFAVKGLFTQDAEEFFRWAFDDIHRSDEYRHFD